MSARDIKQPLDFACGKMTFYNGLNQCKTNGVLIKSVDKGHDIFYRMQGGGSKVRVYEK